MAEKAPCFGDKYRRYIVWGWYGIDGWQIVLEAEHWEEVSAFVLMGAGRPYVVTEYLPLEVVWKEDLDGYKHS